ncbi:MBL fold metallo-hydrolase [uncultured Bacteroides sp.]|uniref:MBL fold metallo-hydrolase n=1 Tax=uncultured Bacteroides sp. TaxID=162156 RepID=UPI002AA8F55D|nr:MBL fold metallo-hydrolase [uncultured Bacteroides sp.]
MNYKITTLAENCVYGKGLQGEHGLSLLIETEGHKILFDTGASDLFLRNARLLGIDLSEVDYVVLSHGHRDHTGGLHSFLAMNSKAKVICKREIFRPKFKDERENGLLHTDALDKKRFLFVEEKTEIVPGIFVLPQIKIIDKADTHFEHFFTEVDGEMRPDAFDDELALILEGEKNISVLSSCSHRGITNIVRTVQEAFQGLALKLVLGGFHIHNAEEEKFNLISAFLGVNLPRRLGVCHCTGIDKYALFRQQFGDRVYYNYTGWVETI